LEGAIRRGLASTLVPGRLEQVADAPPVYVDVGHTPEAVRVVAASARRLFRGVLRVLVLGVSYDKEVEAIVHVLAPLGSHVVCTRAYHKGSPVEEIARLARGCTAAPVEEEPCIEFAMARAVQLAAKMEGVVLVGGGLFLAMEAVEALAGRDPAVLRFL
jgi:dihydrofolate synthase/folylpolyglutamate synthase